MVPSNVLTTGIQTPLNILIVGAGVCGPAIAFLLQKANHRHNITIMERGSTLRAAGQQIDLKNEAPFILEKMGLLDRVKACCVNETGLEVVDANDRQVAFFGVSPSDERGLTLTSEFELMRGDFVGVLYDASIEQDTKLKSIEGYRQGLQYKFGETVEKLDQTPQGPVDVTFSSGKYGGRYDLVIGADGQASRTRRMMFGEKASAASFHPLGIHGAYFSIPGIKNEGSIAKVFFSTGRKMVFTRPSDRPTTGVLFFLRGDFAQLDECYHQSIAAQKAAFTAILDGFEWQKDRFQKGIESTDDFYATKLGQIKLKTLFKDRTVLVGDSGYGPSPFTGLGTTLALLGAYTLAGELTKHGDNMGEALRNYENKMKPFIQEYQQIPSTALSLVFVSSRPAVWLLNQFAWVLSKFSTMMPQRPNVIDYRGRLPEYPELRLVDDTQK
ncbi:uncharacterized protein LALA0_S01e14466g [Lachancea lanzarotensis]|uniref:LALA0S01e14466g1_1 n=1 Tax=Lachancea lanzarotensis TaxID=1245769 RepID=A0A0C7N575_9SACH|nr:uncharacterized protein LALA0_S01e14466g [Lachancea lanzarotensis]CEP60593.1 LALA0S01e14466g1_1 [Lachancea lanzarotensis]